MGTSSHLGHMDRVAATMPSQAHAGAAQEAPDIGHWEGQDVPLVRPSSCNVKGGIPSSRRYVPTYLLGCCGCAGADFFGASPCLCRWFLFRHPPNTFTIKVYLAGVASTANNKVFIIGTLKYSCHGCMLIVASNETGSSDPIFFVEDLFQVPMFIIQIFSFHIRLTRECIVDIVVFICSRWFMEV